ncbi:DUF1501 domain-containing protein [Rubrivirga marina]|uniref:DUF1501 domain-containing protein n=1 Tax=Rubrivirga marina TaxID=1196024 RepID=A0A271J2Q5_9BACT|nr:DUF1501 domain-containing protein [Rubrivirga marina]PAP77630.1 hypothetical protein BSZ37_14860 [Rubrivirga marina]
MTSRRAFLSSGGLALLAAGVGGVPSFLTRAASATPSGSFRRRKVLVTVFQRGAMDGLAAVQPLSDPMLARLRPTLALDARRQLVDLDGRFGLHPSLRPFGDYFREGTLGIVHGVGSPVATRSHFDAQDFMETGRPGDKRADSGWLNRATGLLGHEPSTPFQAVALTPALPLSLRGEAPALAIANLEDFGVMAPGAMAATGESLEALYAQTAGDLLSSAGREGLEAANVLDQARLDQYRPENGADYPRSELGESLRQIAQLIKADVGLQVAFAEAGGWDTHARQGAADGSFARRAADLAQSVAAFWTDLERYQDDVVVLTMTEFGRTVAENGTGGTDHGRASAMFVLGNAVRGGEVHGAPLVLDPDALEDGRDLPVTTDFRALFAGVAGPHLGIATGDGLFPGWAGRPLDVLRS